MAENDPAKDQKPIRLTLPRRDRKFLKAVLTMARDGVRDDLSAHGDRLRRQSCQRRELAAYERLLSAIEGGSLIPDPELRSVLEELAQIVDAGNEYRRAVAEHEAIHRLLSSVGRAKDARSRRSARCAAIRCRGDSPARRH